MQILRVGMFVMCAGLVACAGAAPMGTHMVLLTRGECVNTGEMRSNLEEALASLQPPLTYQLVDLDTLPASDVRRGYPTPTLLYADSDVFGLAAPRPPLPAPT